MENATILVSVLQKLSGAKVTKNVEAESSKTSHNSMLKVTSCR
jgi:hypothetical protein